MMKRVGRILFCFLPVFGAAAIQFLISIPLFGILTMAVLFHSPKTALSLSDLFDTVLSRLSSGSFVIWLSMCCAVVSIFLFGFWYRKKFSNRQPRAGIGINPWIAAAMLLLAVGMQYVTTYLLNFINVLQPGWMQSYDDLMNKVGLDSLSFATIFYACIIAPISEEIIFRGVTLGYAKKAMPAAAAVCLQAFLFGVYHMNIVQGIYATVLGLFLGYVCEAGGTLAIPILFHALFNLLGTFRIPFMYYRIELPFFFLLWLTVGVLLTYAGIFLFQHGVMLRNYHTE